MLCEGCWRLVRAVKKTEHSVEIDENGERDYAKFYRGIWLIKCRGSVAELCQNNNDFRIVPKQ